MKRRDLIGGTAALAVAPVTPPPAKYAQPHPDAVLIAACDRYVALEAEYRALSVRWIEEDDAAPHSVESRALDAAVSAFWKVHPGGLDLIEATPARTTDGLRAKARACHAFYNPTPPEECCEVGAILWGLLCELAEVAA